MNINATAQLEHPEYQGPFLPATAVGPTPSSPDQKVTLLQQELRETLQELLGNASQGSFNVVTQYGWVLGEGSSLCPTTLHLPHGVWGQASQPSPVRIPPQMQRCCWTRMASSCR